MQPEQRKRQKVVVVEVEYCTEKTGRTELDDKNNKNNTAIFKNKQYSAS